MHLECIWKNLDLPERVRIVLVVGSALRLRLGAR